MAAVIFLRQKITQRQAFFSQNCWNHITPCSFQRWYESEVGWSWWWSRYLENVTLDRLHHHRLHRHWLPAQVVVYLRLKHDCWLLTSWVFTEYFTVLCMGWWLGWGVKLPPHITLQLIHVWWVSKFPCFCYESKAVCWAAAYSTYCERGQSSSGRRKAT